MGKVQEKRIEILFVALLTIILGITVWMSILQGRATDSYNVEVIYVGIAFIIYFLFLLRNQVWKRVRGDPDQSDLRSRAAFHQEALPIINCAIYLTPA